MLELNRVTKYDQYKQGLVQSHYVGMSSDTKPTDGADGADLVAGAVFHELDTGVLWWWDGYRWNVPVQTEADKRQERIEVLLRRMVKGLELLNGGKPIPDPGR